MIWRIHIKQNAWLIFVLLIGIVASCQSTKKTVDPPKNVEPKPTDFLYYNPDFKFDADTKLQLEGIYFKILEEDNFGDTYQLLRFYPDGVLIQYIAYTTPEKALKLNKITTGNIHGRYKIENDSLFFTTRVYYDKTQVFHNGKIYQDSLVVNSVNFKTKSQQINTYYFYQE